VAVPPPFHPSDVTILDVCAGFGMLTEAVVIALERLGLRGRVVVHIERDSAAAAALVARMAHSPLDQAPVFSDLARFDGRRWRGCVDIITAGLPCQPYSPAGKRLGNVDHRSHGEDGGGPIPHFLRIIEEMGGAHDGGPAVVFCENVPAWVVGGHFRTVGEELCRLGYTIEDPEFRAAEDVGAPHCRERVFVMAVADAECAKLFLPKAGWRDGAGRAAGGAGSELGFTDGNGLSGARSLSGRAAGVEGADAQLALGPCRGRRELRQPSGRDGFSDGREQELSDDDGAGLRTVGVSGGITRNDNGSGAELAGAVAHPGYGGDGQQYREQLHHDATGLGESGAGLAAGLGLAEPRSQRREKAERGTARADQGPPARGSVAERGRELGDAGGPSGSASELRTSGVERRGARSLQGCGGVPGELDNASGARRDGAGIGPDSDERSGECLFGAGRDFLPLFPPGRGDESDIDHPDWWAWAAVAAVDASLMPRVEPELSVVADGLAFSRADLLRIGGNGVVTLAAADAFDVLLAGVAARLCGEE